MSNIVEMKGKGVSIASAAEAIGEYGLTVPDGGFSEEQHEDVGVLLARVTNAGAWNRGDWYNNQPKVTASAAASKAVVNFTTAKEQCAKLGFVQANIIKEAATAAMFPDQHVRRKLTYNHFDTLRKLKNEYPALDVYRFIDMAVIGDRYPGEFDESQKYRKQPWTVAQMKRAILIDLGDLKNTDTKEVDKAESDALTNVREILDNAKIGARVRDKVCKEVDAEIKAAFAQLRDSFNEQVMEQSKKERADLRHERKRLSAEREKFEHSNSSVDAFMSTEDFKLIQGCLHPDRCDPDKRERYARAFDVFRSLQKVAIIR